MNELLKERTTKFARRQKMLDSQREILSKTKRVFYEPFLTSKKRQPVTQHDSGVVDSKTQFMTRVR